MEIVLNSAIIIVQNLHLSEPPSHESQTSAITPTHSHPLNPSPLGFSSVTTNVTQAQNIKHSRHFNFAVLGEFGRLSREGLGLYGVFIKVV